MEAVIEDSGLSKTVVPSEAKLVDNSQGTTFRPDLGIIVVLRSEFKGVCLAFEDAAGSAYFEPVDANVRTHLYYRSKSRLHGFHIALCLTDVQGASEIPDAVSHLSKHFGVHTIVLIGVSGTLNSKDLGIGHVVVADSVVDSTYRSALVDDVDGHARFLPGGRYWTGDDKLVQLVRQFELRHESDYKHWSSECTNKRLQMFHNADLGPLEPHFRIPIALHVGPISAGVSVIKGSAPKQQIQGTSKTLLAVDTESHAFADQMQKLTRNAEYEHVKFLVIRGISDPADESKEVLDKQKLSYTSRFVIEGEGRFPPFQIEAAYNAGALLIQLIKKGIVPSLTNQLVDEFDESEKRFEEAKRFHEMVKTRAIDVLGELASSISADHVFATNKDSSKALVYKRGETSARRSIADFEHAIEEVLQPAELVAVRTRILDLVKETVMARPKAFSVSVKLQTPTQVQRKRSKPTHVALPTLISKSETFSSEVEEDDVISLEGSAKRGRASSKAKDEVDPEDSPKVQRKLQSKKGKKRKSKEGKH